MRKQFRKFHLAFTVLREFKRGRENLRGGLRRVIVTDLSRERFAIPLLHSWLRIEKIDLARSAHHEERYHRARLWLERRRLGREVESLRADRRLDHRRGEQPIFAE